MKGKRSLLLSVWACLLAGAAAQNSAQSASAAAAQQVPPQQLDKYAVQQGTLVLSKALTPAQCADYLVKGFSELKFGIARQTASDKAALVIASKDSKYLISGFCTLGSKEIFLSILNPFGLDDGPKTILKQINTYYTGK